MIGRRSALVLTFAFGLLAGALLTVWWISRSLPEPGPAPASTRATRPRPDEPRRRAREVHTPPLWAQPHRTDDWHAPASAPGMIQPHAVIVIGIDTLRADHMSAYGYARNTTPNLARLARDEGVLFKNAYSAAPWTLPSMTSIFTSLWTTQHQVEGARDRLSPTIPTVAGAFAVQDWLSAAFVTHIYVSSLFGLDSGFEEFRELSIDWNFGEGQQLRANELNEYVFPWLARHARQRFFLYLHYFDPHADYDPPPPYNTLFDPAYSGPPLGATAYLLRNRKPNQSMSAENLRHVEALYDGEIAFTDAQLERLFERLKALGLWDQTLLVVVADHGEEFLEHGSTGHSKTLYTELTHVPLIIKPPGGVPHGWRRTVEERVSSIDIGPTILQWARLRIPATFSGQSLTPLMRVAGSDRPVLECTVTNNAVLTALMSGPWKLIRRVSTRPGAQPAPNFSLYDLRADPGTLNDVATQHPHQLERLSKEMTDWLATTAAPVEPGNKLSPAELTPAQERQLKALGYL